MLALLQQGGKEVELLRTERPGHATLLARRAVEAGATELLVAGGDGTAFEALNGLLLAKGEANAHQVGLGLIPLGTGNSFLRDVDVDSAEAAVDRILRGVDRRVDVVRFDAGGETGWSINILGVGFIADVCALANRRFKWMGAAAYVAGTAGELASLAPRKLKLTCDGRVYEKEFCSLCLCNSQYTGGTMRMAPEAAIDDGELDVVLVGAMGRFELARTFPKLYSGTHGQNPKVQMWRAKSVEVACEPPGVVMPDGEILGTTPLRCEVVPRVVRLLA